MILFSQMTERKHVGKCIILLISLLGFFCGCTTSPTRTHGKKAEKQSSAQEMKEAEIPFEPIERNVTNPREAHDFSVIEANYKSKQTELLLKNTKAFFQKYSNSVLLDQVYHYRALAFISKKEFANAGINLRRSLSISKDPALRQMLHYNLAYVYSELGEFEPAKQSLRIVVPSRLEDDNRIKYYVLSAKVHRALLDYKTSAEDMLRAIELRADSEARIPSLPSLVRYLDENLAQITDGETLSKFVDDYGSSSAADRLYYRLALFYFNDGKRDESAPLFERVVDDYPQSVHFEAAKDYLKKLRNQYIVDPSKIGVILTLSGRFGKFGQKTLQGIRLAFKEYEKNSQKPLKFIVVDDGGDEDRALAGLDDLFYKHHVIAVIGPMLSKLAQPLAKRAQDMQVPLISLTQKEAIVGDYVFNGGLTPTSQVSEILRYAFEELGARRFAILAPSTKFGEEYTTAFWDEVERRGGTVRGIEKYPENETDFRAYVDRVVGLAYTNARRREITELRDLKEEYKATQKVHPRKLNQMFSLKPIVDFDAVFIPDEPKVLGQILPTFAYRDVEKIPFLGINTWNNRELITRAGQFVEGAVFVDGYFARGKKPSAVKFAERFRTEFQSEPTLMEAAAYDAARITTSILSGTVDSRVEMKQAISEIKEFPGVTGKVDCEDGRLVKQLNLLTVKNGKIEEIAF